MEAEPWKESHRANSKMSAGLSSFQRLKGESVSFPIPVSLLAACIPGLLALPPPSDPTGQHFESLSNTNFFVFLINI